MSWTDEDGGRYVVSGHPDLVAAFMRYGDPDLRADVLAAVVVAAQPVGTLISQRPPPDEDVT